MSLLGLTKELCGSCGFNLHPQAVARVQPFFAEPVSPRPMNRPTRLISSACLAALCALIAACESSHPPRPTEAEADAPRPIGLRGELAYFDGKLRVESTISRGRPVPFKDGEEQAAGGGRRGGGLGGGHGGHRHGGGGGGGGGEMGGEGFGGRTGVAPEADDGSPVLHMRASSLPAVTLRLKFENTSPDPLDVQIRDVTSDLGDFAVRPERLLLAPGQSAEVDPMVSQLGVTSDEFPVTVELRLAGKTEKKDVILRSVSAVPPPPPPAAK